MTGSLSDGSFQENFPGNPRGNRWEWVRVTRSFSQTRRLSMPILVGLALVSILALVAAGGFAAVQQVLRVNSGDTIDTQESEQSEW